MILQLTHRITRQIPPRQLGLAISTGIKAPRTDRDNLNQLILSNLWEMETRSWGVLFNDPIVIIPILPLKRQQPDRVPPQHLLHHPYNLINLFNPNDAEPSNVITFWFPLRHAARDDDFFPEGFAFFDLVPEVGFTRSFDGAAVEDPDG